jgi:multimeric flavodoxin WrbA
MIKIVFLNGSARDNGNTTTLLTEVISNLDRKIFNPTILNISQKNIKYCLGCHECEKTRQCVQNDDMQVIYQQFIDSDIICIASPSYWGYVTGQLKVFFDRSTPFCNTIDGITTFPSGKKGISLSIRAGSNKTESIEIINAIEHYYSHIEIEPIFNLSLETIRTISDFLKPQINDEIIKFCDKLNQWGRNCL